MSSIKKKKSRRQVRRDEVPPLEDEPKYNHKISIGDNDPRLTKTTRELILESLQVWDGKDTEKSNKKYAQTYSGLVSSIDGFPNKRRCLLYMDELEKGGFLISEFPVLVKYKKGNVATVRMFTRIK